MESHKIISLPQEIAEEASDHVGLYTVGLVKINNQRAIQDADLGGSGSLVQVDSVHGIITAAHVVENLPSHGEVGLVRFPKNRPKAPQRHLLDMRFCEFITLGAEPFNATGPDLGFIRLAPEDVEILKARGNVFYNIVSRKDFILQSYPPTKIYFDCISGAIHEFTKDLPSGGLPVNIKLFNTIFLPGLTSNMRTVDGFDLIDFEVNYSESPGLPSSFGGMSGGALWRVFCTKDAGSNISFVDAWLYGITFYQSSVSEKKRFIAIHGPNSVYKKLLDKIQNKFKLISE